MNYVLFSFGLALILIAIIILYQSWINSSHTIGSQQNVAVLGGFGLLGAGILTSIIGAWLIEKGRKSHSSIT